MRKLLFILSCAIILQSCDNDCVMRKKSTNIEETNIEEKKVEETYESLSYTDLIPPILVVAVGKETSTTYSSIMLRDSKGKELTLVGNTAEGAALSQSYKAGDYIK